MDNALRTFGIVKKLMPLVNKILPTDQTHDEPSVLFHGNLSRHNILVDDSGTLTGVVTWECVLALPFWKTCKYPYFWEVDDERRNLIW